jgi:predicted dehydrogenase
MTSSPLRVGIVGGGRMGMVHGSLLRTFSDAAVAAFAEPNTQLHGQTRSQGFDCPIVTSVDEMVRQVGVDAVFICTPNSTHRPILESCIESGVHVFVEKPLADDLPNAERMVDLVRDRQIAHAVGYVYGYLPVFLRIRELLDQGVLGTLHRGRAHCYMSEVFASRTGWYYDRRQSGGGVLPNLGSHLLYLVGMYFGDVREVQAKIQSQFSSVDDAAFALLTFASGVTVSVDVSWSMPGSQMLDLGITIEGERGILVGSKEELLLYRHEAGAGFPQGWNRVHLSDLDAHVDFDISPHIGGEGFYLQARDFIDACRTGARPRSSFYEALNVQRMIHGMYQSAATGAPTTFA